MNEILKGYDKYFLNIYRQFDFVPTSGVGSRLYDENGKEVIDFAGGIAVNALGHSHPELIEALTKQANSLWHVGNIMRNKPSLELARKLVSNTCFDKVFFANSGTEVVEAGLKLARRYATTTYGNHKNKIVSFINGFHGRTLFAVSVGGQSNYCEGFAPLPTGIEHGIFNDIDRLDALIDHNTAVVIVEPIQAEGGIYSATTEFLIKLRNLCDKFKCILMFDEVQTGMGRTGKLFAYMNHGVEPDLISSAKALGNGFPISALLVKEQFCSGFDFGSHGSTFGGNLLATTVANVAFDIINTPEVLNGVKERQKIFAKRLTKLSQNLNVYKEIRGEGLLIGLELYNKYKGLTHEIIKIGLKHGVSVLSASTNVIRLAPSLIIPFEDIDEGINRFENALVEFVEFNS